VNACKILTIMNG